MDVGGYAGEVWVCPRQRITTLSRKLLQMRDLYESHGTLPYPGGSMDQPNFVLQAFETINARLVTLRKQHGT